MDTNMQFQLIALSILIGASLYAGGRSYVEGVAILDRFCRSAQFRKEVLSYPDSMGRTVGERVEMLVREQINRLRSLIDFLLLAALGVGVFALATELSAHGADVSAVGQRIAQAALRIGFGIAGALILSLLNMRFEGRIAACEQRTRADLV